MNDQRNHLKQAHVFDKLFEMMSYFHSIKSVQSSKYILDSVL